MYVIDSINPPKAGKSVNQLITASASRTVQKHKSTSAARPTSWRAIFCIASSEHGTEIGWTITSSLWLAEEEIIEVVNIERENEEQSRQHESHPWHQHCDHDLSPSQAGHMFHSEHHGTVSGTPMYSAANKD